MLKIIRKFFAFCGEENRRKFQKSVVLGTVQALFEALKIPAIATMLQALLAGKVTKGTCMGCLGIMFLSIIGSSIIKYFSTMLQVEGGYSACADKRIEIAKHMRYLPMGYFNENSLGEITSVTTNTMQNLESVATRVVMLVSQGLLTTALIIVMLAFFDWRIALVVFTGLFIFLAVNNKMQKASERVSEKKITADSRMVEKVLEYIQGITEVKAYRLTGEKSRELNDAIDQNTDINTKMEYTFIPYMAVQNFVAKMTGVAMTVLSIGFYISGSLELLNCLVMIISSLLFMPVWRQREITPHCLGRLM